MMDAKRAKWCLPALLLIVLGLLAASPARALQTTFLVTLDKSVQETPFSGRLYVALSNRKEREPRLGMNSWFNPPPLFALDVVDLAPGVTVTFDESALFHPTPLANLKHGPWYVQGVARRSLDSPKPGTGPGDLYSEVVSISIGSGASSLVDLRLTRVVPEQKFEETERVKLFELESPLLSEFHGRPFTLRAGVILPDGWADEPQRRYPIIYRIPGFGGTHFGAPRQGAEVESMPAEHPARRCIQVVLDPSCYHGHSVFADSANNGPWGTALVEEFIPALEEKFRGPLDARFRFTTGGSSGGWASLWLQVAYPDDFGSCYSHVPDPVDFRDFQQIDLYRTGEDMFVDPDGERRPLARNAGGVMLWYDAFVARENVLGPGGQIHSFEAVFSPRGPDGEPLLVFDRETGDVDQAVAETWEPYDIRLVIESNWEELAPKVEGKLHVYAGEVDNFYLEGATRLLRKSLKSLGSDAVCEIIPGMAHASHPEGVEEMYRALLERWDRAQGED